MNTLKGYIFLSFLLSDYISISQISVESKWHHQIYNDVFVIQGNETTNLTKFNSWESIIDFAISYDSNYCFVRHKPNKGNKSYILTLYNLKTLKKINQIIPGYGGDFRWNINSQIIHEWGCGTNCANLIVYDLKLQKIFFTLSSGGFKYSPKKNFIVQFDMHGNEIWVFDLKSLKANSNPKAYNTKIGIDYDWDDFRFLDEYEIIISKVDSLKTSLNINLNNIIWKTTDPKKIGQFYER